MWGFATTHWGLAQRFVARSPRVSLKPELLLVDLGDVLTTGGVTAYLAPSLHLVSKQASPELAALCAKPRSAAASRRAPA
ncbi:hypothetical protein [Myxococcus sp. RHSTA-1-4]|uniref:hypothetical protein n=1 Tax=Myxococcus sp. RHSTA-1-4 TaxID=2874601 RepID=UPI001CBE84CD|nr:hypothetical protein [Myxococcus sp. RHSTA-1-4]MBZ4421106.1 hypothetical protein [Myxococcus sp. RHSTA-1-4]